MSKKFNVTGVCIEGKHYMVNINKKLKNIIRLIEEEEYFIINRPRQYGKTTTLYMIERNLKEDYLVISISFEGIGDLVFENEKIFSKKFLDIIERDVLLTDSELAEFIDNNKSSVNNLDELSYFITKFMIKANKKVILTIDEVDKSSNNQLFLSFLGMLRNKYLLRNINKDKTFHTVILAGVHDIKSLKSNVRPNEESKYNSPWNIATDFDVDMNFSKEEICTMLDDYVEDTGVKLDKEYFSEKLYFYTSGYPFLVSKLCKIIDEKIMDRDSLVWEKEYIEEAVKIILKDSNTNFDSLIKNIENNSELYSLIEQIILKGKKIKYVKSDEIINMASIYGILKEHDGNCKVHNRIYELYLYEHMMVKILRKNIYEDMSNYNYRDNFISSDGLDVERILIKFQEFMKHEYSKNREPFLEHDARLVFLAFISPIINGIGFAFKEVTGGEEKRFDIVITYEKKMYVLELKIWRGEEYHKKGLIQLGEYLDQYNLDKGYLLIFDLREKSLRGKVNELEVDIKDNKKEILEVYC